MTYKTISGDRVDLICSNYYGQQNLAQNIQVVFDANKGLCQYIDTLPAGLSIELPDIEPVIKTQETIELWS